MSAARLSLGSSAFALLAERARGRETIAYADFADVLGLRSPRNLGWLLTPLLDWCRSRDLPLLPIIAVRRADGLPSGGYEPGAIARETERVFAHDWSGIRPPEADDLAAFALFRLPAGLSTPSTLTSGSRPC